MKEKSIPVLGIGGNVWEDFLRCAKIEMYLISQLLDENNVSEIQNDNKVPRYEGWEFS
jgi:hypothetical protein